MIFLEENKKSILVAILLIVGIVGLVMIVGGFFVVDYVDDRMSLYNEVPNRLDQLEEYYDDLDDDDDGMPMASNMRMDAISDVANRLMPTVVGISTITIERNTLFGERAVEGVGSGLIVNENGYILTNSHVVGIKPKKLTVFFMDGKEAQGKILWQDTTFDLAIVKVEMTGLPVAKLADSDKIMVGEAAIAIGNPLGMRYERTVTKGIVSGLNRSIMISESEIMEDLIQTDAAINPGNSGGPLINTMGEVMGINTVKAGAEGLGFAVPINITKPIIKKIIEDGVFYPAFLGVTMLDREIAGYYPEVHVNKGILITNVIENAPAYDAGLKVNDVILKVNDVEVNTIVQLKSMLYSKDEGEIVKITYKRGEATEVVDIKLKVYKGSTS